MPQTKNDQVPKGVYLIINSQVFQISKPKITVGRKLENDIVLRDDTVSREHSEIRFDNNTFTIYDLKSTGGTFVNNEKITKCDLHSGDLITLSMTNILFLQNQSKIQLKAQDKTKNLRDEK